MLMLPMRDGTSEDRATQLLICEPLSFAICEVISISLESPSSSYCFRAFKVCLESKMSEEVSVFSWLVYFLLVLLVSRLSLHHTRYESNLQMRKSKERNSGKSF